MKYRFPEKLLEQHVAVLGKTGSGKTSTAKLIIEQVVEDGARVCILDPIKSDWWGLTSSVDGEHPGLKFNILGGPRAHVPLHAAAGAAIGEIVANGRLPLSILDMAEFEMGGLQQFFTHFAPMLLRKMTGVLYLVIEEAHEFAPKERGGFSAESMAIHYAKKLATAGRSKGIRLILATQRTQSLHNALLGSCDTLIAHRMTAPADQEPIVKWLKANLPPDKAKEVAGSLQSLKTGEGWICSGEAGLFERRQFPRISTYDNTATPTSGSTRIEVKTAAVDQDKLRSIVGTAVEEAKANDPAVLKKQIAELRATVSSLEQSAKRKPVAPLMKPDVVERFVITNDQMAQIIDVGREAAKLDSSAANLLQKVTGIEQTIQRIKNDLQAKRASTVFDGNRPLKTFTVDVPAPKRKLTFVNSAAPVDGDLTPALRKVLTVLAQFPDGCQSGKLALLSGYSYGGGFRNLLSELRGKAYLEGANTDVMRISEAGAAALGPYEPLPTGRALAEYWLNNPRIVPAARRVLSTLLNYPDGISGQDLAAACEPPYQYGGGFRNLLSALRTAGVIVGKNSGTVAASPELFD